MPDGFVGRTEQLARLAALLARVGAPRRDLPGVAVMLRGRRRVGKSRLVEVFTERVGVPAVFFQATQGASATDERAAFAAAVRESSLPARELFDPGITLPTWASLLRQLAACLPDDRKSIVVLDELPWLLDGDPALEGTLQTIWDTVLSRKPLLLVLIGSDLAMMERLDDYRRPFHQRGTVMILPPLNPAEVASMLDLDDADAIDACLVTGGLPLICQDWLPGQSLDDFLAASLSDPTSALLVSGERSLAAEFPDQLRARDVLVAIGTGERTWTGIRGKISAAPDQVSSSSLTAALTLLSEKRVVAVDAPLSTQPSDKLRRYRVADPYLRFYLAFLRAGVSAIERGRPDLVLGRVRRSWTSWRGRAVEPLIRDALLRIAPDLGWPDTEAVGGWWNRRNNPEIDIIGANREPVATSIFFAGSIKWHDARLFDQHDLADLVRGMGSVPGADDATPLVAVSRSGVAEGVPVRPVSPANLLAGWRS